MKASKLLAAILLLSMICSSASAALVVTELTLDPANANTNTITLNFSDLGASTSTVASGNIVANIDIDQLSGVITSIEFDGGALALTDWSVVTAIGLISGTGTTGTTNTPSPPSLVTGSMFDATQSELVLTGGVVNPGGVDVTGTTIAGVGNGMLTSTLNGNMFDVVLTLPLNEINTGLGTTLAISGTVVARGQIAMVPEPSSNLCLAAIATFGMGWMRRRQGRSSAGTR